MPLSQTLRDESAMAMQAARQLNVVSLSIEYPNPAEPGKGLFVRSRLQALGELVQLKVLCPVALVDYAHPDNNWFGSRQVPREVQDGNTTVSYPRWIYPPRGGFLNAFCLFFRILAPLLRLNRTSKLDVLDAHFTHPDGVAAALAGWILKKPVFITARGSELSHQRHPIRKFWMGCAIRRAARVIAVSDNLGEFALSLGADPARVKVIPNGVNNELFYPRDRELCRTKYEIPSTARAILSAGDLAEIKGHHRIIRAISNIRRNGLDATLLIAGGAGRSGRYEQVLRSEVCELGLNDHVRFLGQVNQEQLSELMSAADVFCLASSREGCPNVVTEALACGTPVVATDVGAVRRMLPEEQLGSVVPVGDQSALEDALRRGLARKWDRTLIAKRGVSRTWHHVAEEVATEMRLVVAERTKRQQASPVHLIINADDLGMNCDVNSAIFDLMDRKRITSATLMANGPALDDAVKNLRHAPDCSFGIHLNLTQFEPLSRGSGTKLLTDANGLLHRDIVRSSPTPAFLRAIHAEFCAQIERLLSMGVTISHIDSHHHVHTNPFVFPAIKAVQQKYRINRIRISKNIYADGTPCAPGLRVRKVLYNWALRTFRSSQTTDGFTDLVSFYQAARSRSIHYRTVEIMVHPGDPRAQQESALLSTPWEENLPFYVRHVSYYQLSGGLV